MSENTDLLRSYASGPRIWDAASLVPKVLDLADAGLIEPRARQRRIPADRRRSPGTQRTVVGGDMHAAAIAGQGRAHAHRRPRRMRSVIWRVVRSILATLGALFIVFLVLGLTLGSKPAARAHPAPTITVTRPGPTVTVRVPVSVWANHAVVTVNNPPAPGG